MSRDLMVEIRMSDGRKVATVRKAACLSWSVYETWN